MVAAWQAARSVRVDDLGGGDDACGFRFPRGQSFGYAPGAGGTLEMSFAGTAVARLRWLAPLPAR